MSKSRKTKGPEAPAHPLQQYAVYDKDGPTNRGREPGSATLSHTHTTCPGRRGRAQSTVKAEEECLHVQNSPELEEPSPSKEGDQRPIGTWGNQSRNQRHTEHASRKDWHSREVIQSHWGCHDLEPRYTGYVVGKAQVHQECGNARSASGNE